MKEPRTHPLTRIREQQNLTQDRLADITRISARTIMRAEQNKLIAAESRRRLCEYFGRTAEELGLQLPVTQAMEEEAQIDTESGNIPESLSGVYSIVPQDETQFQFSQAIKQGILPTSPSGVPLMPERLSLPVLSQHEIFIQLAPTDVISTENALWFALKQHQWEALVASYYGRASSWKLLQVQLNQEFDTMKPRLDNTDYTVSRRQALISIAAFPHILLARIQNSMRIGSIEEELFPCCAASIAACWHLIRGNEISLVDELLSQYLSLLVKFVQQPSKYQEIAASLATQGYRIKGILALHRNDVSVREHYFRHAVLYSEVASDPQLQTAALISLSYHNQNPSLSEQIYSKALKYVDVLSPLLLSRLYAQLAVACAMQNQKQEALCYLTLAQDAYPDHPEQDASFLYAEFSQPSFAMENGRTQLALAAYYPNQDFAWQAMDIFSLKEDLLHTSMIPERIRIEMINYQARTALVMKELDSFCEYLERGVRGASALNSQKRRKEAVVLYREASSCWPHEAQIEALRDVFLETEVSQV